jgi:hypothetical protein
MVTIKNWKDILQKCIEKLNISKIKYKKLGKQTNKKEIAFSPNYINKYIYSKNINIYIIRYKNIEIKLNTYNNINDRIIKKMIYRLLLIYYFFKKALNLYLTKYKKRFCKIENGNKRITKEMINSAECVRHKYIIIYRKEECLKTLIHEFVHFTGLDSYLVKHNLCEALAEFVACVLNCIFYSIKYNILLYKLISKEMKHSIKQCAIILLLSGNIKYKNIFNIRDKIHSDSDVFSYYLVKTGMLHNVNNVINNIKQFNNIVYNVTNNNLIYDDIEYKKKYINKNKIYSSRMTIVE